ncbi:hypothetical protein [Pelagimonas varians]|uniref:Uncharacterized protein n=1 Tax=Pelagimonas varians TaxID=696760 RepID=A0A238KTU8_9RHOB|nr:hypothetical protein [Pelagimonas varians]PYG32594.1 hypothetical protein C8N36_103343 [Pelagimonas varians]SMX46080.1 hypothetical protein PEV8663_03187 [Pelagimonas varians]
MLRIQYVFSFLALILAMATSGFAHTGPRPALLQDLVVYAAEGGLHVDICGSPSTEVGTLG